MRFYVSRILVTCILVSMIGISFSYSSSFISAINIVSEQKNSVPVDFVSSGKLSLNFSETTQTVNFNEKTSKIEVNSILAKNEVIPDFEQINSLKAEQTSSIIEQSDDSCYGYDPDGPKLPGTDLLIISLEYFDPNMSFVEDSFGRFASRVNTTGCFTADCENKFGSHRSDEYYLIVNYTVEDPEVEYADYLSYIEYDGNTHFRELTFSPYFEYAPGVNMSILNPLYYVQTYASLLSNGSRNNYYDWGISIESYEQIWVGTRYLSYPVEFSWITPTYSYILQYGHRLGFEMVVFELIYHDAVGIVFNCETGNPYDYIVNFIDSFIHLVKVQDTTAPEIKLSPPDELFYSYTAVSAEISLNWVVDEYLPAQYEIVLGPGNSTLQTGNYTANSLIYYNTTISALNLGQNTLYVNFNDTSGNVASQRLDLFVYQDDDAPIVTPTYETFVQEYGDDPLRFSWNPVDDFPLFYHIYKDGNLIESDSWISGQLVELFTDADVPGIYNYSLYAYDSSHHVTSSTVIIYIVDTIPPVLNRQPNVNFYFTETGYNLIWIPVDLFVPGSYTLYQSQDGILQNELSGTWLSDEELVFGLDGLLAGVYNYTLVVQDKFGNSRQDTTFVTVIFQPPTVNQESSRIIESGVFGQSLLWMPASVRPDYYMLIHNSQMIRTNVAWVSLEIIELSLDYLPVGQHTFEITFFDEFGFSASNRVTITVLDTTLPTVSIPTVTMFELDLITLQNPAYVNWLPRDLNPDQYELTIDGTLIQDGDWASGVEIIHYLTDPQLGTYNYQITVLDLSGNRFQNTTTVKIVDTLQPVVTNLPDEVYEYNNSSYTIVWTATDSNPANYNLTRNNVLIAEEAWISGEINQINLTYPERGVYNFKLTVMDIFGKVSISEFIIEIVDIDFPVIQSPGNTNVTLWSDARVVWVISDAGGGGTYQFSRNGQVISGSSGNWVSNVPFFQSIFTEGLGNYAYQLVASDVIGKITTEEINVTVSLLGASFLPPLSNRTLEFGTTLELTWEPENFDNGEFIISINETIEVVNNYWLAKDAISITIASLPVGEHIYNLTITDFSGTVSTDIVIVNIIDTTSPNLLVPQQANFEHSNPENSIFWEANDFHPSNYTLSISTDGVNFIQNKTGLWTNSQVLEVNLNHLALGVYYYKLEVSDRFKNINSTTVEITIFDTVVPMVKPGMNTTYEFGTNAQFLNWTASDSNAGQFKLYRNLALILQSNWLSHEEIVINITGLLVGFYKYDIYFYDTKNNSAQDTIYLRVKDSTNPHIISVSNEGGKFNKLGEFVIWEAFDLAPGTYRILKDDVEIQSGVWGSIIQIELETSSIGNYNYTLQIFDKSRNFVTNSTIVTIYDSVAPRIETSDSELFVEYGSSDTIISWSIVEETNWMYNITVNNNVIIQNQPGTEQVVYSPNSFALGIHNYALTARDSSNNYFTSSITVRVQDTIKPELRVEPNLNFVDYSSDNLTLEWEANDWLPGNFTLLQNGQQVSHDIWVSGFEIQYSFSIKIPKTHNFTLLIADASNNSIVSEILITVQDRIKPEIAFTGKSIVELITGASYNLNFNTTEDFPSEFSIVKNFYLNSTIIETSNFADLQSHNIDLAGITTFEELYNYFAARPELILMNGTTYSSMLHTAEIPITKLQTESFTIFLFDQSGNLQLMSVNVSTTDTSSPQFLSVPEGEQSGQSHFLWRATDMDVRKGHFTVFVDQTVVRVAEWLPNEEVSIPLTIRELGYYHITLEISDASNNVNSHDFIWKVESSLVENNGSLDLNLMSGQNITYTIQHITLEFTSESSQILSWERPENSNLFTFALLFNGSISKISKLWPENYTVEQNLIDLLPGAYNITLITENAKGDIFINQTILTIEDTIAPTIKLNYQKSILISYTETIVLTAQFNDYGPGSYEIMLDNFLIKSDSWENDRPIPITLSELTENTYELKVTAYDKSGNKNSKSLSIIILELNNTVSTKTSTEIQTSSGFGSFINWWLFSLLLGLIVIILTARKVISKLNNNRSLKK